MTHHSQNTPQRLTARLILRRFVPEDAAVLFAILRDRKANRFLPWFPLQTLGQAKEFLQNRFLRNYESPVGYRCAICRREDNRPIGSLPVRGEDSCDRGSGLQSGYWNRGFATEAAKAVVGRMGADGAMDFLTATHDIKNPASGAVMRKIGMTYRYSYLEQWQPRPSPSPSARTS